MNVSVTAGSIAALSNAPHYTVAALPVSPPPAEGELAWASDGCKTFEMSPPTGTGVPVYYSQGEWRVFSTDEPVVA